MGQTALCVVLRATQIDIIVMRLVGKELTESAGL